MKRKYLDFYLGLFVLAALAAIGYMILKFGGMSTGNRYDLIVQFDFIGGLTKGAPVYHAGVECGKVKEIIHWGKAVEGRPDIPREKVKVIMSIDRNINLWEEDKVKIEVSSLLGEKVVEIVPAAIEEGPKPIQAFPKEKSAGKLYPAVALGTNPVELADQLRGVLGPLGQEETQWHIANILRSFSDSIPLLLANIEQLTGEGMQARVAETVQSLSVAANEFPGVLVDLKTALSTMTGAGQQAQKLLAENREQISGVLVTLDETLNSLDRVVDRFAPIVADIGAGKGGLGKFVNDPSWYTHFNEVLKGLRARGFVGWKGDEDFEKVLEEQQRQASRQPSVRVW